MGLRDIVMGRDSSVKGQILTAYEDMLKLTKTREYRVGTVNIPTHITIPLLNKIDSTFLEHEITNNHQARAVFAQVTNAEPHESLFAQNNSYFVSYNKIIIDPEVQIPNKHQIIAQLQKICDGIQEAAVLLKGKVATELARIENLDELQFLKDNSIYVFKAHLGQLLDPLDQYEKLLNKFRSLPLVALGILAASWLVGKSLSTRSDSKDSIV